MREGELEVLKFKIRQEADQRDRAVIRMEREVEIRERLVQERGQEYVFK